MGGRGRTRALGTGILVIGGGAITLGIVLLTVGLTQRSHYALAHSVCSSPLGQDGQAINTQVASSCSSADLHYWALGWALIVAGPLVALWGAKHLLYGGVLIVEPDLADDKSTAGVRTGTRTTVDRIKPQPPAATPPSPDRNTEPGEPDKPYHCRLCPWSFVSAEKRALHMDNFHPGEPVDLPPPPASHEAPTGPATVGAIPVDRGMTGKPFPCAHCPWTFDSEEKRSKHNRNFHQDVAV